MIAEALKPNVQDLQKDVIDLLDKISSLMHRASTALKSDSTDNKYEKFQQEVAQEVDKVKNLKLRMAIVAPMKAGKSTIINAIIGQNILPSRNAAMTTLPTEVVFNAELTEPTLTLSSEILSVFQKTLLALQRKIQQLGNEELHEQIAQYPHLVDLVQEIKDTVFPTHAITTGREEIIKTLTRLNDIIRLCSLIEPSKDPLGQLIDVPCIETPFWRSQKTNQSEMLGNLVIVDTPGPNEAGENRRLAAVVEEQLRQSSIVLIVLDFTQLKTQAAEEVKKEVEKVIKLRGKENLYVLINKVDQRTESDLTPDLNPEQVRQFVAAEFGIGNAGENRVFEIAARWAFCATNFLQEIEQHPNASIAEMKTARALAQQVNGIDWEDDLKEATPNQLKKKAEKLWEKSGFTPFLDKAINIILKQAAPLCIKNALKLSKNRLMELSDDVNLQRCTIEQDERSIKEEIDALNADLAEIETRRELWQPDIDKIKQNLGTDLNFFLSFMKNNFASAFRTDNLKPQYGTNITYSLSEMECGEITQIDSDVLTDIFLNELNSFGINQLEFQTEEEAIEVSKQIQDCLKKIIITLISKLDESLEASILYYQDELSEVMDNHVDIIVKKAQERLKEKFNVSLTLQPPKINICETSVFNSVTVSKLKPKLHIELYNYFVEKFNRKDLIIKQPYYYIKLEDYVKTANDLIKDEVGNLEKEYRRFFEDGFQQKINQYFEAVKGYLVNYYTILEQAIKDKSLSAENYKELRQTIDGFIWESKKLIEKTEELLIPIHQLLEQ